jgi:drug/metabolite transporter (DMT)-like permease
MTEPAASRGLAYGGVLLAVFSWAIAFPLVTLALAEISPIPLSSARFVTGAVFAGAWILWCRYRLPSRRHVIRFIICAALGSLTYSIGINLGQQTVSPAAASLITNITPILTALVAWPVLGEKFTIVGWIGCLISFAGVSYIAIGQPGGLSFGAGATFVLIASLGAALYFVLQKPLIVIYGALPSTAYTLLFSGLLLLPWFPEAVREVSVASAQTHLVVAGLVLFPTLLAYLGSTYALGHLPAGIMANFLYLIAPVATLLSFLFLGDVPSVPTLIGGAMAILGTVIVARWGKAAAPAE